MRRDEAERDSLARQEEKKASERAAEERKARGRSRFRSKRSRGDTMGRGGFGRIISGASGPFSSGNGAGKSTGGGNYLNKALTSRTGPGRGGSGWFGGGGSGIGGGGGGFGGRGMKPESKGLSFAQGRDIYREPRINADKLHIMSPEEELDSEDEAMVVALSSKDSSKMPMGIYRKEHQEAEIVVATTAELEAKENATGEEESLWVDGESGTLPPPDRPEEGVWGTGSASLIKEEPAAEDAMDVDLAAVPKVEDKAVTAAPVKVKKVLPQDPESKMIQSDLDLLARELGAVTVDGESAPELANKDGRLYLFQFPPLMPPLKETSTPLEPAKVKEETSAVGVDDITASTDNTAVDLTGENDKNGGGEDDDDDVDDDDDDETEEERAKAELKHGFKSQFLSQGGMIGRLNVRRSGKVELDWGGHVLEMSPAAGMNFLTTAVIVEESEEKPVVVSAGASARPTGGDCVGMGKIMGRFVVAPVWSEEDDWDVAPEELQSA